MEITKRKNIRALIRLMKKNDYVIYDKPYQLNIVGVRNDSTTPNSFDDTMYVFWKDDAGKWQGKSYNVTTDPGTFWLNNPMNPQGTAILKQGQYEDAYQIGLHRGEYKALVQRKPVTVMRDYDRNAVLDFVNGKDDTGLFGINIHRANATGTTKTIDKYSAGCQVFENADSFAEFLSLADKHKDLYGNNFTYTLVDERAYNRMLKRRGVYIIGGVLALGAGYFIYKWYTKK
jgi:hypothetical protein